MLAKNALHAKLEFKAINASISMKLTQTEILFLKFKKKSNGIHSTPVGVTLIPIR